MPTCLSATSGKPFLPDKESISGKKQIFVAPSRQIEYLSNYFRTPKQNPTINLAARRNKPFKTTVGNPRNNELCKFQSCSALSRLL
jgi:hypothetical protein